MRWYADDSDLKTAKETEIPNAILFGGIVVAEENEKVLRDAIENAKSNFGHKRAPVKWNFQDLKKKYTDQGHHELYKILLGNRYEIRKAIFDSASEVEFSIILSVAVGYSNTKEDLAKKKSDLTRYVFSNALMRYALHVQEKKPNRAEVILDWPDGNNSKPFDLEYTSAYNKGKTSDGGSYNSGSLESLNFHDSAVFTRMLHSTLLQFSDLLVGATREFVQVAMEQREPGHGVKLLKLVAHKFRGYPNNVINRGIIVNNGSSETKRKITDKFRELFVEDL